MPVTIRQMQILAAVGQTGSLTRAAERLGCTQPAVSIALRELEALLGGPLFQRTTRKLSPTAAGMTALRLAEPMLTANDEFDARVRAAIADENGQVTFAATAAFAATFAPRLMSQFRQTVPSLKIRMIDVSPEAIAVPVQSGEAVFSIGTPTKIWADISIERIIEDVVSVITWPGGPFYDAQRVTWKQIAKLHTISVRRGGGIREVIDSALIKEGMAYTPGEECRFLATALAMARSRLGVLVLPSLLIQGDEHHEFRAVPLVDPLVKRPVSLLRFAGRPISSSARQFIDELKQTINKHAIM